MFSAEEVRSAVQSFRPESAGGCIALRGQHSKDAITCRCPIAAEHALEKLTRLTNVLAAGECPLELVPFLAGAPLTALRKKDDSVRPIAVGETFRRLVGKCFIKSEEVASRFESLFVPRQLGVGVRGGAEVVVRSVNILCKKWGEDPSRAVLKVDFRNTFNTMSREVMLREVQTEFPDLARWMRWCYGQAANLYAGDEGIASESGTQQGDPIAPLLFALALRSVTARLETLCPDFQGEKKYSVPMSTHFFRLGVDRYLHCKC